MADWQKIKTEYITTDTSYRKLAQKYGVDQATIARRAKKEDWVSSRQHHADKTQAKILEADSRKKATRAEKLQSVADLLMRKVEELLENMEPADMDTQAIRHISATLKDLKEIQMIRSEKDLQEQDARIAKLRKETESDEGNREPVRVIIEDGLEEYSK